MYVCKQMLIERTQKGKTKQIPLGTVSFNKPRNRF